MEAKLKALKVLDLKDILTKAAQPPPPKATKADLIARILASKEATAVCTAKFAPKDDLLAPPEDLDWDVDQVNPPSEHPNQSSADATVKPTPKTDSPTAKPAPAPTPAPVSPAAPPSPSAAEDPELEKRRKRAERFGVPLVEARPPVPTKKAAHAPAAAPATAKNPDNPEKLNARAARFGIQKRPAPVEDVDPEEQERRKKRAERFGTGPAKA